MNECVIIAGLLDSIEQAIKSGDWVVDGANDPSHAIDLAEMYLHDKGWIQNSIDNSWMKDHG